MEVKKDGEIRELYEGMMESMTRLVRNERDAFSIIWFDIYGYLEPKDSAWKADLYGVLTAKIIGENIGERVHVPVQDNMPYYQIVQTKYAFGKRIGELGEYWKELIQEEKYFRLKILYACLYHYYTAIMPYIKNEIVAWWSEACHRNPELSPTLKPYKEHRAKIKATMQVVGTVLDIIRLQRTESDNEED